jgi:hypothetical protein
MVSLKPRRRVRSAAAVTAARAGESIRGGSAPSTGRSRIRNTLVGRGGQRLACMRSVANRTHLALVLASLLALVAVACAAPTAGAEAWGELEGFKPERLKDEANTFAETEPPPKFAAAPNGVYYVLAPGKRGGFVLQRFHEDELQAETPLLEPPAPRIPEEVEGKEVVQAGTEAANAVLAVSPSGKQAYVLFVYDRREQEERIEYEGEYEGEVKAREEPLLEKAREKARAEHRPLTEEEIKEIESKATEESHERYPLDSEMPAAGSLYAFEYVEYDNEQKKLVSAKTEEDKLTREQVPVPALDGEEMNANAQELGQEAVEQLQKNLEHEKPAKTKTEIDEVISKRDKELKPTERPLLDPRGMAVDPATGDLVISGNEDEAQREPVNEGKEDKQCRAALQFVKTTGRSGDLELSLGARYVDEQDGVLFGRAAKTEENGCGEAQEEEGGIEQAPASPVFAPDGSVLGYDEYKAEEEPGLGQPHCDVAVGEPPEDCVGVEDSIWQLTPPLSKEKEEAPGVVEMSPKLLFVPKTVEPFEFEESQGQPSSVMSLVPTTHEGMTSTTEGTIYLAGDDLFESNEAPAVTVLHYSHPSGGEPSITGIGWIGGARPGEHYRRLECNLHEENEGPTMLGGLSQQDGKPGFLALVFYEERFVEHANEPYAEVLEFGEGGNPQPCPQVPVTTPVVSDAKGGTKPEAGTNLTITSTLGDQGGAVAAAAAKSVTWVVRLTSADGAGEETSYNTNFENELPNWEEEIRSGQLEEFHLLPGELTFDYTPTKVGTYEITDIVHTDDLADEIARPEEPARVTVGPSELTVEPNVPEPWAVFAHEQEARLSARVEGKGKEDLRVKRVVWEFEGTRDEETSPKLPVAPEVTVEVKHTFNRCATAPSTKCKIVVTVEAETASGDVHTGSAHFEMTVLETKSEREQEEAERSLFGGGGGGSGSGGGSGGGSSGGGAAGSSGVQVYKASFSGSSLSVSPSGAVPVKIICPSGGACEGTLTLQTLNAVAGSAGPQLAHPRASKKKSKKKILTLASSPYSLTGGSKSVTLHLKSAARALLSRSHGVLRAKLEILSRGVGGHQNMTTTVVVTLRLVKPHKVSHKR